MVAFFSDQAVGSTVNYYLPINFFCQKSPVNYGPPMNHCEWRRHSHSWRLYFEKKIIVLILLQTMSIQSFLVVPKLKSQTKKKLFICICCMSYIFSFKITATDVTIVVAVVNKKD